MSKWWWKYSVIFLNQACGKTFTRRPHLQEHMILHSQDRPFKCSYCDEHFKSRFARLKHHEKHHLGEQCTQEVSIPTHCSPGSLKLPSCSLWWSLSFFFFTSRSFSLWDLWATVQWHRKQKATHWVHPWRQEKMDLLCLWKICSGKVCLFPYAIIPCV